MANERVFQYRNTGTAEAPVWEKWFQITVADAVRIANEDGTPSEKNILEYVSAVSYTHLDVYKRQI